MNRKTLAIFCVILAAIAATSTALYINTKDKLNEVLNKPEDEVLRSLLNEMESQRDVHRLRAEFFELQADSLLNEYNKISKKSQKTKIQYVQDINAWRALPDNDRDIRVQFFTKEFATVDSIPEW